MATIPFLTNTSFSAAVTVGNTLTVSNALTVGGNLLGNTSNTTELGVYSTNAIKRIRMVQGGELHFGDTTVGAPLGITEGNWNSFGDNDFLSIYGRSSIKLYAGATAAVLAATLQSTGLTLNTITNVTTDTDKFLVSDSGIVKYRTGAQVLSDIGGAPATGGSYLPLAGGTMTGLPILGNVSSDQKIQFQRTGGNIYSIEHDSSQLYFYNRTTAEAPLVIQNDGDVLMNAGNVGIGLTGPDSKLDINAGVSNVVSGPAVRISKGASPIGLIRYDTLVVEANDVATIRIGESDGTVSTIMSGDNNMRINSTDPIKFYTNGTTTGEGHAGQGGTLALTINNSQISTFGSPTNALGNLNAAGQIYIEHQGTDWNETTPGTGRGTLHFDPVGNGAANTGNAITFGASDHSGGTVADAGIYTRSDGTYGTKMYFATTDSYALGSKTRMMINANGNIGIGVTNPNTKLHVSNPTKINDAYGLFLVENTATGASATTNSGVNVKNYSGTSQFMQWENNGLRIGSRLLTNSGVGDLYFTAGADSVKMVVKAGGNVGIGTTGPNNILELAKTVDSDIGPVLQLTNTQYANADNSGSSIQFRGYTLWGPGSSNPRYSEINAINGSGSVPKRIEFKFYADTDVKTPLSVLQTGNVGIGTTSPDARLEVAGGSTGIILSNLGDSSAYDAVRMTYNGYNSGSPEFIFQPKTAPGSGTVNSYFRFKTLGSTGKNIANVTVDGNVGIGTTAPSAKLDVVGNIKSPTNSLSTTAAPTSFGVYTSEVRLIDTPNGGLKKCRVITDVYGEWILVGRFAASAMNAIANAATWSSVSGMTTGTAQNETTQFSADFGDSLPEEVRIMGATDFTSWRDTRTVDFVYKVPKGRKWKFFFSGGATSGMTSVGPNHSGNNKFGWNINGSYDGFGRWINPLQTSVGMSDTNVTNPSAAYTTATANAFAWDTADDAKITVTATRTFSGQDSFETAGFGNDDNIYGFFDEYPNETNNMQGGVDFSSAAWVLIKLPEGASGSGGSGTNYWAANGNDISNTNSGSVGIGTDTPDSKLDVKGPSASPADGNQTLSITNTTGGTQLNLGTAENSYGWIEAREGATLRNLLLQPNSGNVGIGVTDPNVKLRIAGTQGNPATSGSTSTGFLSLYAASSTHGLMMGVQNASPFGSWIQSQDKTNHAINYNLLLNPNGGNVGIGTVSPTAYGATANTLEVRGVSGNGAGVFRVSNGDNTVGGTFYSGSASSTLGTQTAHPLYLSTNNSTKMTILSGGNVGIGNTSPDEKLEVSGSSSTTYPKIKISNPSQTSRYMSIGMIDSVNHCIEANGGSTFLTFRTSGAQKMVIDTSGNVGIGATNPTTRLTIQGGHSGTEAARMNIYYQGSQADRNAYLDMWASEPGVTYNGSGMGSNILGTPYYGKKTSTQGMAYIRFVDGAVGLWAGPVADNVATERIKIEPDGDVGIGDSTPSYKLDVAGTIRATGDVIAYSDARVKENIKTIDNALNKIDKLRGVEFNKIGEDIKSIGVIAQEIEKVIPEVVREDDKGMKSVAYGNISGLLIEAIKELKAEIDLLKSKPCTCNKCNCNI